MNWRPFRIEDALNDPKRVFGSPENVISDPRLDRSSKLEILRRWQARFRKTSGDREPPATTAALRDRVESAINRLQRSGQ